MRILGYIHTFNDADVIHRSVAALLDQTHPLDEILIVDNASEDGTVNGTFPTSVTVVRLSENRGTSGAVTIGFRYALDKGYDWIWVLDADSAPRKDALEKLLLLYQSFPPHVREQTRLLNSLPVECANKHPYQGIIFDRQGFHFCKPGATDEYYEYDAAMWTGSLFKVEAVRQLGMPSPNYVVEWDDYEYGYRGKRAGLKAFMHLTSIVDHNIRGQTSVTFKTYHFGPLSFKVFDFPARRCYYSLRHTLYFWLYEYKPRRYYPLFITVPNLMLFTMNFLCRPVSRKAHWIACLRGLRDGFLKRLDRRY